MGRRAIQSGHRGAPERRRDAIRRRAHSGVSRGGRHHAMGYSPDHDEMELRTYECDACGHSQTYSVTGGDS